MKSISSTTPIGLALLACASLPSGAVAAEAVEVTTLTGSPGNGGITVHANGDLYVGEYGNYFDNDGTRIFRISPDGSHETFADGLGLANSGNDFDAQGNLIQSAWGSDVVRRISPDGSASTIAEVPGPVGVVVADDGDIFVASCSPPHAIMRIASNGGVSTFAENLNFNCPNGLTAGPDGSLYTINWQSGHIFRIDGDGEVTQLANLGTPGAHIVYGNGELYATARNAHRVYRVTLDGEVSVLAGTGVDGNQDGPPDEARFSGLNGIAISNDESELYVNGTSSAAVQGGTSFNQIRVIALADSAPDVNFGHTGSWFNPDTDGQGFSIEVVPSADPDQPDLLVAYWFTFAPGEPGGTDTLRWYQALGPIEGNRAEMDVFEVTGGVFDDPTPTEPARVAGTATIEFLSCTEASLDYELDLDGDDSRETSGTIPLGRLTPDYLCADLSS